MLFNRLQSLLLVTLVILIAGGSWFYVEQRAAMHDEVKRNLTSVAQLKANQITAWYQDQLQDAELITSLVREETLNLAEGAPGQAENRLKNLLVSLATQHDYDNILYVSTEGELLYSLHPEVDYSGEVHFSAVLSVFKTGEPVFIDIHKGNGSLNPHITVAAPLYTEDEGASTPSGAFLFVNNASQFLYPLLESWPTANETAETMLVSSEGEYVTYLSPLLHEDYEPLNMRLPADESCVSLPAHSKENGDSSTFVQTTDYRGVDVSAITIPIEDTPWFITAKMDSSEALADWRVRSMLLLSLLLGLTALSGGIMYALQQRDRRKHFKTLYQSELQLRTQAEQQSVILRSIGDAVIAADTHGKIKLLNRTAEELTGWSEAEAKDKPIEEIFQIVNAHTQEHAQDFLKRIVEEHVVIGLANHTKLIARDGSEYQIADSGAPVTDDEGNITGVVIVFRNVTQEYQMREAIKLSENTYRTIFENTGAATCIIEQNGIISLVNDQFAQLTGYSRDEIQDKMHFCEFAAPEHVNLIEHQRNLRLQDSSEALSEYEFELTNRGGDPKHIRVYIDIIPETKKQVASLLDISTLRAAEQERENLQHQLQHNQKMEAVGRLAGGVAHDFNNMLGVIQGYAELSLAEIDSSTQLHDNIQEILNAANRSSEITRKLLGFARKQPIEPQIINLNTVIGDMFNMLRRLIGEDVTIGWNPDSEVWPIEADPVQIEQVVANLCLNARDAVEKGGSITLETGNANLDAEFYSQHGGKQPGSYTRMSVSDTGCGMDAQTKIQALDPFFTTKEVGKGSGLGLATVYGIVKQNNGMIVIDSEPGLGTRIDMYLPSSTESKNVTEDSHNENYIPLGHGEYILLLEDEQSLRDITTHMLERLGFQVLPASSPAGVLEQANNGSLQFDLLLTDVIMPETNGKELKDHLSRICPPFKTVFMSGYSTEIIANQGIIREGIKFLQKPFTLQQLAKKIREALNEE